VLRVGLRYLFRLIVIIISCCVSHASEPALIRVDFSRDLGSVRLLDGINKGPLAPGGMLDLTQAHRELGVPFVRLHDCHWPNPDVVDIHAIFPDPEADPDFPSSYDFSLTDEYISAIRATGAQIIYRLGESIEHTSRKRFVHPPRDPAKWAKVCLGIVRHYNEGWANGFHHNISYWEIWNEPENRPAMWTGTDAQYFALYQETARALKHHDPQLKIGGPAVGFSGEFKNGTFSPSPFVVTFLELCRRESLPLDFFSWHCYTDDPSELTRRSQAIRSLLNTKGFTKTESHLNEWNFLPQKSWKPLSKSAQPETRERFYTEMSGASGAAFIASALIELQDAPVEICNLFHGELGGFGLFNENGVPYQNYYALRAFNQTSRSGERVAVIGTTPGKLAALATLNAQRKETTILLVNYRSDADQVRIDLENLPWPTPGKAEIALLNEKSQWSTNRIQVSRSGIQIELKAPSVAAVRLRP